MNITEAKKMAKDVATENALFGWKIFFSDTDKICGACWQGVKALEFSEPYFQLNNLHNCKDTVLHEIAHALVGLGHDHDWVWQVKAMELGAIPEACVDARRTDVEIPWEAANELEAYEVSMYMNYQYTCRADEYENIRIDQKLLE